MKIRIGNDVHMQWFIMKDKLPYLINKTAKVRLLDPFGKPCVIETEIIDNKVNIIYRGKNQVTFGKYSLILVENDELDEMVTVDALNVFELTKHTNKKSCNECTDVLVEVPDIYSNVEMYILPVANATTLGGVMPVEKTEDMTVNVGVDAIGRLFTKDNKYDDTQIKNDVANNTSLLGEQKIAIEANTTLIGKNTADIQQHTADIALNVKSIGEINDALLLKAEKTELENLATKEELTPLATKEELTPLATKEELNAKADKTALNDLATLSDVEAAKYNDTQIRADIESINNQLNGADVTVQNINNIIG